MDVVLPTITIINRFRRQCHLGRQNCLIMIIMVVIAAIIGSKQNVGADANVLVSPARYNSPMFYLKMKKQTETRWPSSSSSSSSLSRPALKNSKIFHLPMKLVSNGKPSAIDVIHYGLSHYHNSSPSHHHPYHNSNQILPYFKPKMKKTQYKSPSSFSSYHKKTSKMYYLPTKFVSNGKPIKPITIIGQHHHSSNYPHGF